MMRRAFFAKPAAAQESSRGSLSREVVEALGRAIVSGHGKGDWPIKVGLHRQLGVSRTTVREAVKVLMAKGLLEARPRKGTWAAGPDHWSLFDFDVFTWLVESTRSAPLEEFAAVRLAVEPCAAAIAAVAATTGQRQAVIAAAARAAAGEPGSAAAFHVEVLNASGNRFFVQLGKLIEVVWRQEVVARTDPHEDAVDRRRVAEAILDGDSAAAASAMHDLVTRAAPRPLPKR